MDFTAMGQTKAVTTRKPWFLVRRGGMLRLVCKLREDDEVLREFKPAA